MSFAYIIIIIFAKFFIPSIIYTLYSNFVLCFLFLIFMSTLVASGHTNKQKTDALDMKELARETEELKR